MIRTLVSIPLLLLTVIPGLARADFSVAPRYEYVAGNGEELANRLLIKSKLNASGKYFGIYLDGFAEFDESKVEADIRRSPHRGYLQEAYVEFKRNSVYVKAGRQALRWSEMWVVPSMDIWTARRWNRMYLDPLSEQLVHPTGLSFSYAPQGFSIDLVGITHLAENTFPKPLPDPSPQKENELHGGARLQFDLGQFHFSTIAAKQSAAFLYGVGANYAFESFVPKLEVGGRSDDTTSPVYKKSEEVYGSLGADVFLGNWILTPQVTVFDYGETRIPNGDAQAIFYLSSQWKVEPHDFQAMGFVNSENKDYFWSLSYSYNLNRFFSVGGFVQEYYGEKNTLHWLYRQMTGDGVVAGLRLELTGDWSF